MGQAKHNRDALPRRPRPGIPPPEGHDRPGGPGRRPGLRLRPGAARRALRLSCRRGAGRPGGPVRDRVPARRRGLPAPRDAAGGAQLRGARGADRRRLGGLPRVAHPRGLGRDRRLRRLGGARPLRRHGPSPRPLDGSAPRLPLGGVRGIGRPASRPSAPTATPPPSSRLACRDRPSAASSRRPAPRRCTAWATAPPEGARSGHQSITAAFRMHTIVAWAGTGPTLRMTWARSQR